MTIERTYNWIELAALLNDGTMVRNQYARIGDDQAIGTWRNRFANTNIFSSVGIYTRPSYDAKFVAPIFFDIDSADDLQGARVSALMLCEMLMSRAFIPQDGLDIYFSGNKGFHILIPCELFDAFYSPHTLELYRRMAEKAEEGGVQFLDKGVYTNKRIWRLPNSIHGKSHLFKIPLSYEELRDVSMAGIMKLAEHPRPQDSFAIPQLCEKAAAWYHWAIACCQDKKSKHSYSRKINTKFKKGWRIPPCVKAIETAVVPDGIRHQLYVSLARYYGYLNMHHDEMLGRLEAIDQRNPVRDPDSIERAVSFGCAHPGFPGCDDPAIARYCQKNKCFYANLKGSRTKEPQKQPTGRRHNVGAS
jgi:hypothetical protein